MNRYKYKYLLLLPLLLSACRDDSMRLDVGQDGNAMEVRLQAEIDQLNLTRANDSGFADGDVIGVYAVDFSGGQPGTLTVSGNNADNVAFTFDEGSYRWNSSSAILFSDDKTPMDLYGYYPYSKSVDNVEAYPISVEYNQSGDSKVRNMTAYEASDFLWAKSAGLTASDPSTILYFKHMLASVRVTLMEGEGFAENEWNGLDKSVLVCGTSRDATVNLATGEVKVTGGNDGRSIIAKNEHGDFRAIVIPQTINAGSDLLCIKVGEKSYKFQKEDDMTFFPTKQHTFTMKVNKNLSTGNLEFLLEDEAVTAWESDLESHNGSVREYMVVEIPNSGSLASEIESHAINPSEIINLKLKGCMNEDDFAFIRNKMTNLEAINLQEVDLSDVSIDCSYGRIDNVVPDYAFATMASLKSSVLPNKLKAIGKFAFYGTSLSGSLEIPEGVIEVGEFAYSNHYDENAGYSEIPGGQYINHNNLKGTLSLPSTLKVIGGDAFRSCDFSGTLILPENLEAIGAAAFSGCRFFTGALRIPDSVQEIGDEAFAGMKGLTDVVKLPKNLTTLKGRLLSGTSINRIQWPDHLREIEYGVFLDAKFKDDIALPNSIVKIGSDCFNGSNIKRISLLSNITVVSSSSFWNCYELMDSLIIPSNVEVIESNAFSGCSKISALVLPASLQRIDENAFSGCYNVSYMRCDATEPPVLLGNPFEGVEKDNFTLEVPENSVDAYRNAPGWSEFKRISSYRNFVARPSKFNVLNKGGKKEIVLNADSDWEMTECPNWCHIDKKSGAHKTVLELTVDPLVKGSAAREGIISFKLKNSDEHITHINVGQFDYEYDEDQYLSLQSSTKGNGINLVFIGDGYDAADIATGSYLSDMKQEMEYFFGVEPYSAYREYFNVYTAFALSEDSGIETLNTWRTTKFSVSIGDGLNQRLSADWKGALDYCAANIPPTLEGSNPQVGCVLVGNSDIYEGITYIGDSFCSVVTKSTSNYPYDARGLVQHEVGGHGIGWLGDEYIYHKARIQKCSCPCCSHVLELMADHANGFALNMSLIGKYKEVPWTHLLFKKEYSDIVDVYEGGYFHSRGVYRSEYNSCMNNNVPYFSTWSRQLIVERIMKLAGEKFDLNSFYAKDSRATGRDFTSTSRGGNLNVVNAPVRHGNAPVRITGYKFGQKGGRK